MKLLRCNDCGDVFSLRYRARTCECGKVGGRYLCSVQAEYWGNSTPIGLANEDLDQAAFRWALEQESTAIRCWADGSSNWDQVEVRDE